MSTNSARVYGYTYLSPFSATRDKNPPEMYSHGGSKDTMVQKREGENRKREVPGEKEKREKSGKSRRGKRLTRFFDQPGNSYVFFAANSSSSSRVSPDAKGPISSCVTISFEVFLADNSITSIDEKLPGLFFLFFSVL